jgi:sugar lactone lactonase YvrE
MMPNMNRLRRLGAACLATLTLAACQPATFGAFPQAQVATGDLFLDAGDGGDAMLTIAPLVAPGRHVLGAVAPTPPYTLSQIDHVDVSLYRVGGAEAGLRKAGVITGNPTGKTVTVGRLRPSASYRLVFVAKDINGNVLTAANQGVDFTLDASGVPSLAGPVTIQLAGAVRPGTAMTIPGFDVVEFGTPVKGFVIAHGDNLTAAPGGLAAGPDGALYVATTAGIQKLNPDGTRDALFQVTGLSSPSDVIVVGSTLYIADAGNNRIVTAPLAGGAATAFGASVPAPASLALGPDGHVYVSTGNRVARLNAAGEAATFLSAETIALAYVPPGDLIGDPTDDAREIDAATIAAAAASLSTGGLTFDSKGNLYVIERSHKDIWKVTPDGTTKVTQGGAPGGVIDIVHGTDSRLYMTSADKKIYTSDTGDAPVLLAGGGTAGTVEAFGGGAGFVGLSGIAVDADGLVYVAETGATPRIRKVL